jgi:hypothetical protein
MPHKKAHLPRQKHLWNATKERSVRRQYDVTELFAPNDNDVERQTQTALLAQCSKSIH